MRVAVSISASNDAKISQERKNALKENLWKYKALYLMSIPGILYFIVFKYIPLAGTIIAFQEYSIFKGFLHSPFVGFKHFQALFQYAEFWSILKNTLVINFYDVALGFPAPIILALMLNEVTKMYFKRTIQTIVYLPHFLSWVVIGGMFITEILSPQTGLINIFIKYLGFEPIYFLSKAEFARGIVVGAAIWKDVGWGTIIYLAAIAGINPNLYDAASVDGAGRMRQLIHITIPAVIPVMTTVFLIKIGHFLDTGFERIWVFRNGANRETIDIFETYIYQVGLLQSRFSYTTAIGVFKSVVGFLLLSLGNLASKKTTGEGIF